MAVNTAFPGTCYICHQTLPGNRIHRHLLHCIESRTGLKPSQDPRRRDRRRTAQKTAHLSVRARERPHWMELGVRCDATLRDLDWFLRAVWMECCGHVSDFMIGYYIYSEMVPRSGDPWRHTGKTVNAAIPPLARFEYEHDYGSPTKLDLEHCAVFGELVQAVSPAQPWHGGKIVILARNNPLQVCLRCGRPAHWRADLELGEFEVYEEDFYESEGVLCADDLDPITFCEECAPAASDLLPLPNSPRVGVKCYDNAYSGRSWPLRIPVRGS